MHDPLPQNNCRTSASCIISLAACAAGAAAARANTDTAAQEATTACGSAAFSTSDARH